ncbi:hypothetical protein GCM10011494_39240 [Novosphingobium endophyticum]|uniref:HTH tetR-type domain-containing protein n=1 Tax=Novosphingobium endophyticum TaxID=1955250 RepID=A0A916X7R8_9SPHN|nr:TetR family transcriptional regulator [Novosphingobium endophyticum]GGC16520.1 hypothetical protein GCM10011494_39240 [Novosphingobium endophyticum]
MARKRTNIPTKPDDARSTRSIEALQQALLELLDTRSFDQVTIKDITEAAGLSYPTFFRRFAGKDDLLEHIAAGEVRRLLKLGEAALGAREPSSSAQMCEYVQANRKLWTTLLTGGASSAMRTEFMRIAREIAYSRPQANPWLPIDLAVPFVTSGIFEILAWWMRQPEDYPVDHVIKLFNALVVDITARPRTLSFA